MAVKLFNNYMRGPVIALIVAETVAIYLAIFLACHVRSNVFDIGNPESPTLFSQSSLFVVVVLLLGLLAVGLYQFDQRFNVKETLARLIVCFVVGWFFIAGVYFVLPSLSLPRLVVIFTAVLAFFLLTLIRVIFLRTVDEDTFKRKCLVYGTGEAAMKIARLRRRSDRRGFRVAGYIHPEGSANEVAAMETGKQVFEDERSILEIASETGADEIVVALDDRRGHLPIDDLLSCKLRGLSVVPLVGFFEREMGKLRIDLMNPSWIIFSDGFRNTPLRNFTKTGLDLAVAVFALMLVWPVMLFTALAIKLEEGLAAPVFYRQIRVGLHGEPFGVLKFRSMRVDAEADGKARWATKDDDRITRVGRFIRKTRLDELPQLLNVLKGDMSVVGPRPERPTFVDELSASIQYYSERHTVKPGITGWAQLKYPYGSSEKDAIEKLQFDLFYVKNNGFMFDLAIMLQTVEVVLFGKGAR